MSSDDTTNLKRCTKCFEWKPRTVEYFHRANWLSDGLRPDCATCSNALAKAYRDSTPTEIKQLKRHLDYMKNRDSRLAAVREYRANNPDKVKESLKATRLKNKDKIAERAKIKYWANKESINAYCSIWRKKNKDKCRTYYHKRMALQASLPSDLTPAEWEDIKAEFNYCCAYCGKAWFEINGILQQEHVIPVKQGGGYTKENIVPSCARCNRMKRDKTPEQAGMTIIRKTNGME